MVGIHYCKLSRTLLLSAMETIRTVLFYILLKGKESFDYVREIGHHRQGS